MALLTKFASTGSNWGTHTSLYKSLSEEGIRFVEQAIWLKMTGRMDASREIFEQHLIPLQHLPIVAIERAVLEQEAGRWGKAWSILDEAIKRAQYHDTDLDLPEYRLIALMRAMFGIRHRGDLNFALQELRRTKAWLCDVQISEYTDIQSNCIRFYSMTYLFTRLSSNFQDPAMEQIPLSGSIASSSIESWQGLHDLRRSLISRQMFNEANALFRVEMNRTPLTQREPFVNEFLDGIACLPSQAGKSFIESSIHLQWSVTCAQNADADRALSELVKSEACLTTWRQEFGITDEWAIPHFQAILTTKLDFIGDAIVRLQFAEDMANTFENMDSSKTGSVLSTASDTAYTLFQETGKEEYLEKFFALHRRLERYDEEVSEDLCDLIVHRNSLISATAANLVDRQKSLEWIEGFFIRYPYFQNPGELESLYRRQSILLRGLQKTEESNAAEATANKLKDIGPSLGKWLNMSHRNLLSQVRPRDAISGQFPDEDEDEGVFFEPWAAVVGDSGKVAETACDLVSNWAAEDVMNGLLATARYEEMLGTPYQAHGKDANKPCEGVNNGQKNLWMGILIPQDQCSAEVNKRKWGLVSEWLCRPPKGQLMRRLFALLMLRDCRQYHFSDRHLWNLRIEELEEIMEFHAKLPPTIQEVTRSQLTSWFCALTTTYLAKFWDGLAVADPDAFSCVFEAEKYSTLAINALRHDFQPGQLLIQLRVGAQICLLRIAKLEEDLKQGSITTSNASKQSEDTDIADKSPSNSLNEEIECLRICGLKTIEESEKIATASELEASWSEGLDGVKERQSVSEFQMSFSTVHTALNLLLKETEVSPSTVVSIWSWVQKYKARSLSRTIGSRSRIPPSLLAQIRSSAEASSLYDEMLAVEDQITRANKSARFALRQQLDAIRHRMRANTTLQRLVDLREGSPLTLSEVKIIEEKAGHPIVFVDWFYVPAYPGPESGKLLLLTARSDQQPTLDVLETTLDDVHTWQQEFLNPQSLTLPETRHEYNKRLGGLVAPLMKYSEANDLLVFCPSVSLHRLPLHALNVVVGGPEIDDKYTQPIVHRNPVVYIHSHSLLRSSFSTAEQAATSVNSVNPQFVSGISELDAIAEVDGHKTDYTSGRTSIRDLASLFTATPLIDDNATKTVFLGAMTKSRLVHMHTHCNWSFSEPLDHHLEFPNLHRSESAEMSRDLKLTAKEIFETHLLPGTHFNLVACQGGLMEVKMGDEVMGLVPALLYSGATSTVSTLWSIADDDGAQFSKLFFQSFLAQCQEQLENSIRNVPEHRDRSSQISPSSSACFVDIALALQDALIELDPYGHESLYSWAAFVLHGYWMFPLSQNDLIRYG